MLINYYLKEYFCIKYIFLVNVSYSNYILEMYFAGRFFSIANDFWTSEKSRLNIDTLCDTCHKIQYERYFLFKHFQYIIILTTKWISRLFAIVNSNLSFYNLKIQSVSDLSYNSCFRDIVFIFIINLLDKDKSNENANKYKLLNIAISFADAIANICNIIW